MYANITGSISQIKNRPVFLKKDFSQLPLEHVNNISKKYKSKDNIDAWAAEFYLSNHIFHLIEGRFGQDAPLPKEYMEIVNRHVSRINELGIKMFLYLVIISAEEACFGEARNSGLWDFVSNSSSPAAAEYLKTLFNKSSGVGLLSSKNNVLLGDALKAIEMGFRFGKWSLGFGSLPWAQITQTAHEIATGVSSLELGIDKAFTLCHNNGAIFNKFHIFNCYSNDFYTILDIQASGQMPNAINSKVKISAFGDKNVKELFELGKKLFPNEFLTPYDPSRVKSMEKVRRAKEDAAAKKTSAWLSSGGGGGGTSQLNDVPPSRACDNLLTLDEIEGIHKNLNTGFFK